jgi:hypothetical protein
MALDLPTWALIAINKICQNYLWRGRKEALGGHCLITWPKVTHPKELRGLGIPHLKNLNWALRLQWLWLREKEPNKPWASLPFQANADLKAFFSMAVVTEIGDGANTLFWQDGWLFGKTINEIAPLISTLVPTRIANRWTVFEAMTDFRWVNNICGTVTVQVLLEFLNLCDLIDEMSLQPGVEDKHSWCLSTSGKYLAKLAYNTLFQGSIPFNVWECIWKSWAPNKCRFFLWLVAHNHCWTDDRLACCDLPHSD